MTTHGLSSEARLQRIEARHGIEDLVARYALAADRKNDPVMMSALLSADATWSAAGFATLEGRKAVTRGLADIAANRVLWSIHFMVAPLIVIDESLETATCQWYLLECCTMAVKEGAQDQWLGGWYDTHVVLTEDGWRFDRITLDVRLEGDVTPPWAVKKETP